MVVCLEASGVAKRLREERNSEPLQSLVTRTIWGFGALTYKSVLMGKRHMSQFHQQSWCHTVELGLWMQAWEGAHGLECSRKLLQEEMRMNPNLLKTTGLAPYPIGEMPLLLLISWTCILAKKVLICYIQWEGWGLLWGRRVLHSDLMNSGFFYTPYLFQLEALVGSHRREMEKWKTEILRYLYR